MKTIFCLLFLLSTVCCFGQIKHPSSVMGAGGETMQTSSHILRGTVSQFAIDYLQASQGDHGVGFWYQPSLLYKFRDNSSYILIPKIAANSGDFVNIPIILESSNHLLQSGAKTFEAKIRFNKSLLEPIEPAQFETVGDNYIIIVTGSVKDTTGILYTMRFRARLGNDSITPLAFESFRWIETTKLKTATQDGEFTLNDLCKAGGTTRLIKKGTTLTLAPITPNPVKNSTVISFVLNERTIVKVTIVDILGHELSILRNLELNTGTYEINYDASLLPNGKYFVVLRTENDVLFEPMQISK